MNQFINSYELFSEILKDIYSPVEDGWSTLDVVLRESGEKLDLLRAVTVLIFPDDEDYFVRQLGGDNLMIDDDFNIMITLKF